MKTLNSKSNKCSDSIDELAVLPVEVTRTNKGKDGMCFNVVKQSFCICLGVMPKSKNDQ